MVRQTMAQPDSALVSTLLRLLEETVPVPLIALSENRDSDMQPVSYDDQQPELLQAARLVYHSLCQSMSDDEARRYLLMTEPFSDYPQLLESL